MATNRSLTERFGANLLRERRRADLSQEALGFLAGVHRTEVSTLERGLRVPRVDTLIKLSAGIDISPCDLLVGIVWRLPTYSRGGFETQGEEGRSTDGPRAFGDEDET